MTMASGLYGVSLQDIFDATQLAVNTASDSFTHTLHTDTYTPDFNAHDLYNDLTNELATAGGYTQNNKALTTVTFVVSAGFVKLDCDDTAWTAATFSGVRGRVINDGTLTGDPLICGTTFGADYGVTAGTFTVQEHANGILRVDIIP